MNKKKYTFFGIADCHGIESLIPIEKAQRNLWIEDSHPEVPMAILKIRADANRQRHTVLYKISITETQYLKISKLIKEGKHKEALLYIKKNVDDIGIEHGREKSWRMIPNDDLDPWG
jgi:hypothetical protein